MEIKEFPDNNHIPEQGKVVSPSVHVFRDWLKSDKAGCWGYPYTKPGAAGRDARSTAGGFVPESLR